MSAIYSIASDKLSHLIGTAACPVLVDFPTDEDFEADPHFIPGRGAAESCRCRGMGAEPSLWMIDGC
jgi:hypothetical protein